MCFQHTNLTEIKKNVPARATEPSAKIENKLPARATELIFPYSSTRCSCTGFESRVQLTRTRVRAEKLKSSKRHLSERPVPNSRINLGGPGWLNFTIGRPGRPRFGSARLRFGSARLRCGSASARLGSGSAALRFDKMI